MKWLTKLTIENDRYIEEFTFKSDSKRDCDKTFQILSNRYNGLDYSSTQIEDQFGNKVAELKRKDKISIDENKWNIIAAIISVGIVIIVGWYMIDIVINCK